MGSTVIEILFTSNCWKNLFHLQVHGEAGLTATGLENLSEETPLAVEGVLLTTLRSWYVYNKGFPTMSKTCGSGLTLFLFDLICATL